MEIPKGRGGPFMTVKNVAVTSLHSTGIWNHAFFNDIALAQLRYSGVNFTLIIKYFQIIISHTLSINN